MEDTNKRYRDETPSTNRYARVANFLSDKGKKSPSMALVSTPQRYDIILGRGKGPDRHPGNTRMREILRRYRERYFDVTERVVKRRIVMKAYHEIVKDGARFLKQIEGEWVVVDKETAKVKINDCLRCARHFQRQQEMPDEPMMSYDNCDEGANLQSQKQEEKPDDSRMNQEDMSDVPRANCNIGDEGVSRQCPFNLSRTSSTKVHSIHRPLRNAYLPFIPLSASMSETMLWNRLQNQMYAQHHQYHRYAHYWSPSRSLLQAPHSVPLVDFVRHPFGIIPVPDVVAFNLASRTSFTLNQAGHGQRMGNLAPYYQRTFGSSF